MRRYLSSSLRLSAAEPEQKSQFEQEIMQKFGAASMVELPRCIDATLKYRRAYGDQSRAEVRAIQSQIYKMRAYEQRQLV